MIKTGTLEQFSLSRFFCLLQNGNRLFLVAMECMKAWRLA
jgi:hypothetical protein